MRKAITILMLAIAIIAGGAIAEAKTTKKASNTQKAKKTSSSSSSTFNLKTLTSKFQNKNIDVFQVSISQLNSAMKELGFSQWGTPYRSSVYKEIDDSLEPVTGYCYGKSGINAYLFVNDYRNLMKILIEFPSVSKANAFISSSKSALGNALKGSSNEYSYLTRHVYWTMTQDGSTIEILLEEDMG